MPSSPIRSTASASNSICTKNALGDRVRIYPIAASSQAGELELIHPQSAGANHGMASFYKSLAGEGTTFNVLTARLDELL